jgi:hypothetical protein
LLLARLGILALLVSFVGAAVWPAAANAVGPAYFEAHSGLPLSFQQCMQRATAAFKAEGIAPVNADASTLVGGTPTDSAVIFCDYGSQRGQSSVYHLVVMGTNSTQLGRALAQRMQAGTTAASACTSPAGTWSWFDGSTVTFAASGRAARSDGHTGTWASIAGGSYQYYVHWDYPTDDYFTISPDGKTMTGSFNGTQGTSTRPRC